jgi:hypothetical protein
MLNSKIEVGMKNWNSLNLFRNGASRINKTKIYNSISFLNRLQQIRNKTPITNREDLKNKSKNINVRCRNIVSAKIISNRGGEALKNKNEWRKSKEKIEGYLTTIKIIDESNGCI